MLDKDSKKRFDIKTIYRALVEITIGEEKKDLFISYSWGNKDKVHKMCVELERKGYKLWWDKNDMKYGILDEIMQKGIDQSKLFVCCVSTAYCKRDKEGNPGNALKEHQYATKNKNSDEIIYVLFETYENEDVMKERLYSIWFNFSKYYYYKPEKLEDIIKAIEYLKRKNIKSKDGCLINDSIQTVQVFIVSLDFKFTTRFTKFLKNLFILFIILRKIISDKLSFVFNHRLNLVD